MPHTQDHQPVYFNVALHIHVFVLDIANLLNFLEVLMPNLATKKPPLPFEEEGVGGNGLTGDDHESRVEL